MAEDLESWAAREGLPEKVAQVLKEQDFNTVKDLMDLSLEDVDECFRKPQLLSVRHCLTLKKAVANLRGDDTPPFPEVSTSAAVAAAAQAPSDVMTRSGTFPPYRQEYQDCWPAASGSDSDVDSLAMTQPQSGHVKQIREKFDQPSAVKERSAQQEPHRGQKTASEQEKPKGFFSFLQPFWRQREIEEFRFLMLGKTGSGKSTTGNTILGEKKFASSMLFSSVTTKCELQRVNKHGRFIEIMDCPGLYDTSKTQEEISTTIVQAVACTHPGPHAVLYIVRLGRYTEEESGVFKRLKALFDDEITKYIIVLFTGGDELEAEGKTLADMIHHAPASLLQVIEECGNRCLVFNNKAKNPKPQVENLLKQVREMKQQYNNEYYTCPKFSRIGEGLEEEVQKRLAAMEQRDHEREKYVCELEAREKEIKKELAKARAEMERKDHEWELKIKEEKEKSRREVEKRRQDQKAREPKLNVEKESDEKELEEKEQQIKKHEVELKQKREEERKRRENDLKRLQEEKEAFEREKQEEAKQEEERKERAYQEELNRMKDGVAKGEEQGWVDWASQKAASALSAPFRFVSGLFRS